jgi:ADP-ribosylglycohydrolase
VKPEDLENLTPREDRRAGAILGLATGDALGATHEFSSPEEVLEGPLEIVGGGWLRLEPGETTDDTALAGAVLEGYRGSTLDLGLVRNAMLRWEDSRPKDIGNQTRKAFGYLRSHQEALSLPEEPEAQGNGAVMRAAPHGVMAGDAGEAAENAWREAALTHPSWEARASSALVAALVAPHQRRRSRRRSRWSSQEIGPAKACARCCAPWRSTNTIPAGGPSTLRGLLCCACSRPRISAPAWRA